MYTSSCEAGILFGEKEGAAFRESCFEAVLRKSFESRAADREEAHFPPFTKDTKTLCSGVNLFGVERYQFAES